MVTSDRVFFVKMYMPGRLDPTQMLQSCFKSASKAFKTWSYTWVAEKTLKHQLSSLLLASTVPRDVLIRCHTVALRHPPTTT